MRGSIFLVNGNSIYWKRNTHWSISRRSISPSWSWSGCILHLRVPIPFLSRSPSLTKRRMSFHYGRMHHPYLCEFVLVRPLIWRLASKDTVFIAVYGALRFSYSQTKGGFSLVRLILAFSDFGYIKSSKTTSSRPSLSSASFSLGLVEASYLLALLLLSNFVPCDLHPAAQGGGLQEWFQRFCANPFIGCHYALHEELLTSYSVVS